MPKPKSLCNAQLVGFNILLPQGFLQSYFFHVSFSNYCFKVSKISEHVISGGNYWTVSIFWFFVHVADEEISSFYCVGDFVLIKGLRLAEFYKKVSILQDFVIIILNTFFIVYIYNCTWIWTSGPTRGCFGTWLGSPKLTWRQRRYDSAESLWSLTLWLCFGILFLIMSTTESGNGIFTQLTCSLKKSELKLYYHTIIHNNTW